MEEEDPTDVVALEGVVDDAVVPLVVAVMAVEPPSQMVYQASQPFVHTKQGLLVDMRNMGSTAKVDHWNWVAGALLHHLLAVKWVPSRRHSSKQ